MLGGLKFDVVGEVQYARAFDALAHELEDLSEPLGKIAHSLIRTVGQQFVTEGSHGGSKWQPLNYKYEEWKNEHYPGRPMMVRSGTLRTALLVEGVRELTKNRLVYGVEGPAEKYAAAHQKGTGRLPQRKLISLTQSERRGWDRIFHEWIIKQRRGVLR